MVDTEPQPAHPAAASDAPVTEPVAAVHPGHLAEKDDAQASLEPISSATDTSLPQSAVAADGLASDSPKGKEKETVATAEDPTTDVPPALPTKEDADSLSIEPSVPATQSDNPVCNITLLLPTGARHPYKIDERYLTKRSVDVPDTTDAGKKDPFSVSVYTLKELILREWREEWNDKPASPSSIRLIHFGKLLDDKEQLKSELPIVPATLA
jgi:hypothetical protein